MSNKNNKNTTTEGSGKPEFSRRKTLKGASAGAFGGVLLTMGREWQNDDRYTAKKVNDATIIRISGTKEDPVRSVEIDKAVDKAISRSESEDGAVVLRPGGAQNIPTTLLSNFAGDPGSIGEEITGDVVDNLPTNKLVEFCYAIKDGNKSLHLLGYLQGDARSTDSIRETANKFVQDPTIVEGSNATRNSNSEKDAGGETKTKPDLDSESGDITTSENTMFRYSEEEDSSWDIKTSGRVRVETCQYGEAIFDFIMRHNPWSDTESGWAVDVNGKAWPRSADPPHCDPPETYCQRNWNLDAQAIEITFEDSSLAMRGNKYDPDTPHSGNEYSVTIGWPIAALNWKYKTYDSELYSDIKDERAYWATHWEKWWNHAVDEYRNWEPGGTAISPDPRDCENVEGDGSIKIADFAGATRYKNGRGYTRSCGSTYTSHTPYIEVWWRNRCC